MGFWPQGSKDSYSLASDTGAESVSAGSVAEEVLATVVIPGNSLGIHGSVSIDTIWQANNNANAKTCRIRFSGPAGTIYLERDLANNVAAYLQTVISNDHSNAAQIGGTIQGGHGLSAVALPASAVNTLVDTTIVFTGQKANGADTLTLEHFNVVLSPSN